MVFDPLGYTLAFAITKDPRMSIIGGMLGGNPAGVLLLAAANQGGLGGGTATTAPRSSTTTQAPSRVQVPDLPDDQDGAKQVLETRGLVATVETVASEEPIDVVIGSDPPAGSVVRSGSRVTVLVSAGVLVPDVTGKEFDEAEQKLR